jgi:hypothetical protein
MTDWVNPKDLGKLKAFITIIIIIHCFITLCVVHGIGEWRNTFRGRSTTAFLFFPYLLFSISTYLCLAVIYKFTYLDMAFLHRHSHLNAVYPLTCHVSCSLFQLALYAR